MYRLSSISFLYALGLWLGLGQTAYGTQKCPVSGILEKLVDPEKTEDGFVRATSVLYTLGYSTQLHPAKYEILTQAEYEALDDNMTFTTYEWKYAEYSTTPIEPVTDIAEYDIILTLDGNQFHRPLEKVFNRIPIEFHELVKPSYREERRVSEKRPEPEELANGRLKVMMSPEHHEPLGGKRNGFSEHWSHYIKRRTPATYQQVKCSVGN